MGPPDPPPVEARVVRMASSRVPAAATTPALEHLVNPMVHGLQSLRCPGERSCLGLQPSLAAGPLLWRRWEDQKGRACTLTCLEEHRSQPRGGGLRLQHFLKAHHVSVPSGTAPCAYDPGGGTRVLVVLLSFLGSGGGGGERGAWGPQAYSASPSTRPPASCPSPFAMPGSRHKCGPL